MGGAAIDKNAKASKGRLFVAGEDSGGVHGANRLGGNGICDSCVYGRQAGKAMSDFLKKHREPAPESAPGMAADLAKWYMRPLQRVKGTDLFELRDRLRELNWNKVGIGRKEPDLSEAVKEIEEIAAQTEQIRIANSGAYNMPWHVYIDLMNMIEVSRMVCESAKQREETRGAHFRIDYPEQNDAYGLFNIFQQRGPGGKRKLEKKPVDFKYIPLEKCQRYKK
jgi:succinate dehydrogenase / fumarate reductase flavoprotein subunit/fumarate reductase flavoprotein subunit